MPSRPSLLSRLFLLLGVLGAGFLLLAVHLYQATDRILTEELKKELVGDLAWLEHQTRADPGLLVFPRSDSLVKAVARSKGYRLTLIGADGKLLGESDVPRDNVVGVESHSWRPEVIEARNSPTGIGTALRYSSTVEQKMFYVAKSLGPRSPVLRIAAGPSTLDGFRYAALRTSLLALLLFFAAAGILTFWVSRRISQPLLRLRGAARDVSRPLRWDAPFREAEILNEAFTDYAEAVQKLAAELRLERDRLLALLNRLEEGVLLLDGAGRIRAANAAARLLLPLRPGSEPLEGKRFGEVVRHEGLSAWVAQERSADAPGGLYQLEKSPESPMDLMCRLRALQSGTAGEALLTLVDVTPLRNLDRAKTDFVANASHELKTPLSSILGYSETLLEGAMENEAARGPFVRKIHANAQRLQGLVQDLLNLSQLESQGASHSEMLPVRDFVEAAWVQHRPEAERNGIRFENRVPPRMTWKMQPRDLDLILGNLIGNAVKYNPPGGKVRIEWDAAHRVLGVRDTGHGIPAESLPHIFERFYRGDAERARGEGTGLGLAIVKHAAQRYGIQVSAESILGQGSVFLLEAPMELMG
jgi:two-component system phosphate regulon sensor histidine kinase PhoR